MHRFHFPIAHTKPLYHIGSLVALLVLVMIVLYAPIQRHTTRTEGLSMPFAPRTLATRTIHDTSSSYNAQAYIVLDAETGFVLREYRAYTPLPLASLTKLMTAYVAMNTYSSTTKITIPADVTDFGLSSGQAWSMRDLVSYMLVISSNDAANIIAQKLGGTSAFIRTMNETASRENLSLSYQNPSGLDIDDTHTGGIGTAYALAKLLHLLYIRYPSLLEASTDTRDSYHTSTGSVQGVPNTNQHVGSFIGLLASKTGYTDLAGGNLAVITDQLLGRPIIVVVLGSTKDDRFEVARALGNDTIKEIERGNQSQFLAPSK